LDAAGFRPDRKRTYALVGIERLVPHWSELQGQLLVSKQCEILARGKAGYCESFVVGPEAETDFEFQELPAQHVGAGSESL
jgi:uncharacterized protein involved in copper resistance